MRGRSLQDVDVASWNASMLDCKQALRAGSVVCSLCASDGLLFAGLADGTVKVILALLRLISAGLLKKICPALGLGDAATDERV